MDEVDIKPILESLLFVSGTPIRFETLIEILPEFGQEAIRKGIQQIQADCEEASRGVELVEVAGGYQFRTKPQWAEWVNRLKKVKAVKLSRSALETLAIIAYRQPVIRPEIEQIRGVGFGVGSSDPDGEGAGEDDGKEGPSRATHDLWDHEGFS